MIHLDDGVVELTKITTGGNPKARIFTAIGGAVGNVISGAVTTGASSVATIANQKSTAGDMAKAVFDLALMYQGGKGSDAINFFDSFTVDAITQGYLENTSSDGIKKLVDAINVAVDDVNKTVNGNNAPTPTVAPDNPNETIGDYSMFCEKSITKIGEKIAVSVNEVEGANYKWYLGDAQNTVVEGTHMMEVAYYTTAYHYPKVEIYDVGGTILGSATNDIYTEYYDAEINCSNNNPKVGEEITFTTVGFDKDSSIEWDLGDGNIKTGNDAYSYSYGLPSNYKVYATMFKEFEGVGIVPLGQASCEVNVTHDFVLSASATSVKVGQSVTFEVEPWLERIYYTWNMGDGSTYEGAYVEHSYSQAGQYTVNVQVVDENSVLFEDNVIIFVQEPDVDEKPSEQYQLTASNASPALGDEVIFSLVGDMKEPISWYVNEEYIGTYTYEANNQFDWKFTKAGTYVVSAKVDVGEGGDYVYDTLASITFDVQDNVGLTIDYTAKKLDNGDVIYTFTASPDYTSKGYIYRWQVSNSGWMSQSGTTAVWRLYSSDNEFETEVYVSVQEGNNLITSKEITVNFVH
jgi:hypothetical protein